MLSSAEPSTSLLQNMSDSSIESAPVDFELPQPIAKVREAIDAIKFDCDSLDIDGTALLSDWRLSEGVTQPAHSRAGKSHGY